MPLRRAPVLFSKDSYAFATTQSPQESKQPAPRASRQTGSNQWQHIDRQARLFGSRRMIRRFPDLRPDDGSSSSLAEIHNARSCDCRPHFLFCTPDKASNSSPRGGREGSTHHHEWSSGSYLITWESAGQGKVAFLFLCIILFFPGQLWSRRQGGRL